MRAKFVQANLGVWNILLSASFTTFNKQLSQHVKLWSAEQLTVLSGGRNRYN